MGGILQPIYIYIYRFSLLGVSNAISQNVVPVCWINDKSGVAVVINWVKTGAKPLHEPMMNQLNESNYIPEPCLHIQTVFPGIGIPIVKMRRSGRLLFLIKIPRVVRRHVYIQTGTSS